MKYIRTKDGRIVETPFMTNLDTPYKFADTIEELCDEFVVFDNNGKPQVYTPFDLSKWTTDHLLYGAIWADKGLIYVAKMKGVLPNGEIDWELL